MAVFSFPADDARRQVLRLLPCRVRHRAGCPHPLRGTHALPVTVVWPGEYIARHLILVVPGNASDTNSKMIRTKFSPRRKSVGLVGTGSLAAGVGGAWLAVHWESSLIAVISGIAILFAVFLFGPVIRNQTIEVSDRSIVVHTFGRSVELTADHLTEIVRRKGGGLSYRFRSGNSFYQITPMGYYDARKFEREFDRLFALKSLGRLNPLPYQHP